VNKNNHSPKPVRSSFTDLLNTNERFKKAITRNRASLERFFANNQHLLSKANISVYRQLNDISKQTGFNISHQVYSQIKLGKQLVCSKAIVWVISDYWDLDGVDMETRDMRKEDELIQKVA
jgi:hypothetical protein